MEQPWKNQQQRDDGGFAMGEGSYDAANLDQTMTTTDPCEVVDGTLLMMELMDQDDDDDLPSSDLLLDDGDVDRQLSHVIRSLEAEIGGGDGGEAAVMTTMADGGGGESLERIEDVLSSDDMDGAGAYDDYEGASSSSFLLAGHDEAEGWCVYTNTNNGYEEGGGVLGYDTTVDHHHYYYCCAEGFADHMYLPLWE